MICVNLFQIFYYKHTELPPNVELMLSLDQIVLVLCMFVGDWHCAYVLLYGPRVLELKEGEELGKAKTEEAMETENAATEGEKAMDTAQS